MKSKKLLFSVTKKDLEIKTFQAGGKGGQHQNKTDSAVRITHRASGAVGVSRDHRSQHRNKREAFRRMVDSKTFKNWIKIESARVNGEQARIEEDVDRMMHPRFIKVETFEPKPDEG